MSLRKNERVAFIRGANRGIGLETARQLSHRGFHVVTTARDEEKGRRVAEEIRAGGGHASSLMVLGARLCNSTAQGLATAWVDRGCFDWPCAPPVRRGSSRCARL